MKKFLLRVTAVAVFVIPFLLISVIIDPYSVFHVKDVKINAIESNSNFVKTKYILSEKEKFNGFIFGSSRAGVIDPSGITDANYYNMYYSEGMPAEHIENLKTFVNKGVKVDEVLIVLDNIAPFVAPELHETQDIRRPYKNGQLDLVFLAHYLNPAKALKSTEIVSPFEEKLDNSQYYSKGWICHLESLDEEIERDPQAHAQKEVFKSAQWGDYFSYRGDEAIEELKTLIDYCNEKQIKTTVCVCPLYKETYLKSVENGYLDYLAQIAEITPFYSFTGLNSVTADPYYYYENSHYRRIVGDMMIDVMYNSSNNLPDVLKNQGFGAYIDSGNSEAYINALKLQVEAEKNEIQS